MINQATQHSEDDLQSALCHFSAFKYLKLLKMEIKENVLSAAVLSVYCYTVCVSKNFQYLHFW